MYKIVLLAGGKGTRLRPYTENIPKPLVKLGNKTLIEYVLSNIKRAGIDKVIIATGYLGEMIENYLGNSWEGMELKYFREENLEGTAGCLLKMKDLLEDDFLVVMADHITTIPLDKLYEKHLSEKALATIAIKPYNVIIDYGVVKINERKILNFEEKPVYQFFINTGIYALNKKIFNYIKIGYDFAKDVFPKLLNNNEFISYFISEEFWTDVGKVKDYEQYRDQLAMIEVYTKLLK